MNQLRFFLWLSVVTNVLLFVCLAWVMIKPSPKPTVGSQTAAALQMKLGYENGPIILLLDNEFDKNASFKLFDKDQGLAISKHVAPTADEANVKGVSITIKEDLDLTCYYVPEPKPEFRSFFLTLDDRVLQDLNADGRYDLQIWFSRAKKSNGDRAIDVWYKNEWQEVVGGSNYISENVLKNGLKVSFDRTSGRWVPLGAK